MDIITCTRRVDLV